MERQHSGCVRRLHSSEIILVGTPGRVEGVATLPVALPQVDRASASGGQLVADTMAS